ncbi:MAG: glutamate 5-kinase [Gammaproteobacteria bacterium]|nr:MAG: glutamate 5-kinase [Gammaproteobacteria bacterium]
MSVDARKALTKGRRWVVKIGSALLTAEGRGLDRQALADWVAQLMALRQQGVEVVLVSSGAVAEGMVRLGWKARPSRLSELQAAAAVGQMGLVQAWEHAFQSHGVHTAQVLLTHDDLSDRKRYLNARNTLRTLVGVGVVPVVNENDTVVTDEIRFGDNDTLGALVANVTEADALILLTDQDGLYDKNPREHSDATLVDVTRASNPELDHMAGGGGALGRGGMITKVRAARLAARSGAATVIVGGRMPDVLVRLRQGARLGTLLEPDSERWAARKQWIASQLQVRGRVYLDEGAARVLRDHGRSLLPVGVSRVEGAFRQGELVECVAPDGRVIAKGLVNYDAEDAARIVRKPSSEIAAVLGYMNEPELIHRDNMVIV